MMKRVPIFLLALSASCASNDLSVRYSPAQRVDVVVVPGCPPAADGSLSPCLARRVLWAAHLWSRQLTHRFITSGGAAYNRYVEAEAMAAGLVALGVPAERIWLEQQSLHTDENMYYSRRIMLQLGLTSVAVASVQSHASGGCSFLESWGQPCTAAGMDNELVDARLADPRYAMPLARVRVLPVTDPDWLPVRELEARRAEKGGPTRPSSFWLYLWAPVRRLFGTPWSPLPPRDEPPLCYRDLLVKQP